MLDDDQVVELDMAAQLKEINSKLTLICSVLHLIPQPAITPERMAEGKLKTKGEIDFLVNKIVAKSQKREKKKANGIKA